VTEQNRSAGHPSEDNIMRCSWARDARGSVLTDGEFDFGIDRFPGSHVHPRRALRKKKAARETRQIPIPKAEAALGDNNHRRVATCRAGPNPNSCRGARTQGSRRRPDFCCWRVGMKGASPLALRSPSVGSADSDDPICESREETNRPSGFLSQKSKSLISTASAA